MGRNWVPANLWPSTKVIRAIVRVIWKLIVFIIKPNYSVSAGRCKTRECWIPRYRDLTGYTTDIFSLSWNSGTVLCDLSGFLWNPGLTTADTHWAMNFRKQMKTIWQKTAKMEGLSIPICSMYSIFTIIYLQNWAIYVFVFVGKYSSTMEHTWDMTWYEWVPTTLE